MHTINHEIIKNNVRKFNTNFISSLQAFPKSMIRSTFTKEINKNKNQKYYFHGGILK